MATLKRMFVVAGVAALILPIFILNSSSRANSSTKASRCTYVDLEVATTWGTGGLAGHFGVPFLIVNTSRYDCYLEGYPNLRFSSDPMHHRIVVQHGTVKNGAGAYAYVLPHRVLLKPGQIANFGMTAGDAANQQDRNRADCNVTAVYTELPVAGPQQFFENFIEFNLCFSDFTVITTAIQPGPVPRGFPNT
jgi:hypothetical protein